MSKHRYLVVLLACFACAILDGYAIQVVAFAIPVMKRDWSVPLQAFGIVFSAGLVGLVGGSLFFAPLADRHGRRTVIILAALGAAASTLANSLVSSVEWLVLCRVFVGISVGVMTALVVAIAFEAAPQRHRALAVAAIGTGFSLGSMVSGVIAAIVIPHFGWKALFLGASAFALIVAILFFVSLTDGPIPAARAEIRPRGAVQALLGRELRPLTMIMWLLHFGAVGALYMLLSWLPSLLTRSGYTAADAAFSTSLVSFGGLFGGITAGFLLSRFGLKCLLVCYIMAFALIALLPLCFHTELLRGMNVVIGVCVIGGYVANNIVASAVYPVHLRASGVGWAQGIGRTGSVVSPLLVALALRLNATNESILLIAAAFPLLSGFAIFLLMRQLRSSSLSRTDTSVLAH